MNKKTSIFILLLSVFGALSFTKPPNDKELITFKYYCAPNSIASIQAISNGSWNNAATWNTNQVPTLEDDVTIPSGFVVTLSQGSLARSVRVDGTLKPLNLTSDFSIETKGIMIHSGGKLLIGSETNAYTGNGLITLIGTNSNEILMSSSPIMGSKLIGVMDGGILDLHGTSRKTWTQLNETAEKDATSITLKETINWNVGDEIVIASTDFDPHQAEKRTITEINGKIISFVEPLNYMHFGVLQTYNNGTEYKILDERAEVGLLTHNLKIQGDSDSDLNGYGGHIMSMPNSVSKASNIELYRMGQKSKIGKYPWHWHLLGDADGQYIKNTGIHKSYNRVITVHGTNNTVVEGNVGYDFIGHGYFLENGSETGNLFKNNLGVVCKRPVEGEETTPHDLGIGAQNGAHPEAFPATFWITNPNNDYIGNVSAGSDGSGFWHLILNKVLDGPDQNYRPGIQPMGIFNDNKAHSNLFSWGVDGGVDRDSDEIVNGHYRPQNSDGSQFIPEIHRFDGYKSVDRNVWIRANTMNFYDCDFGDNGRADFFSYNQTLFNSLIVGKSANIGNPSSASENQAGRSLPYPERPVDNFHNAFRGHSIYDGPSGIVDTHFDGFNQNGAKSYSFQINGASRKSTNHFARGITFGPDVDENAKFDFDYNSFFSYMYLSGLIDEDGSLTGVVGANIRPLIKANPGTKNLYEKGANTQMTDAIEKPEWGAWLTENKTYNYFVDTDETNKVNGAFTPRYFIAEYPNKTSYAVFNTQTQQQYFDAPVITNDLDYTYYMQYHKLPFLMRSELNGTKTNSENVIVAYSNIPGISYGGNANRVTSMSLLKASTSQAYFIKDNTVYFKFISNNIQSETFQRQFGNNYRFESKDAFLCNTGNCSDTSIRSNIINKVTLIDYSVRTMDLGSIETNDDTRDSANTSDELTMPIFSYNDRKVNFNVENNGNGISGHTDYIITLQSRQVWEYFETLSLDYTGPSVEIIVESENGDQFSAGTYSDNDSNNVRIGQNNHFSKYTNVKKLILRFHESNLGDINTASSNQVTINQILLGIDIPDTYSDSSTLVSQDSDGDGILDEDEIDNCRNFSSASDFALEFNEDNNIFDNYTPMFLENIEESNGILKATSTGGDSKLIKNSFVNFNGSNVTSLTFRYKANIALTKLQLFWETTDNNNFSAARTISENYTGNGAWQEIVFDLSNHSEWGNKTIIGFRIDPTNNNNVTFEIDWIRAQNAFDVSNSCIPQIDNDNDGLYNKEEEELCRDIDSASDFALEFNGDDIFNGFNDNSIDNLEEVNGVLRGTSNTNDPKITNNNFVSFSGTEVTSLTVRMKANIDHTKFQLFWANEEEGITANKSVSTNYNGNGNWQEIILDLSTHTEWKNKIIKGFRIDPTDNLNVNFEIDWIRAQNAKDESISCVVDTTIPVITLIGNNTENIEVGSNYTDAGATATDNYDGDITNSIQVTGNVNTNIVGTYTLTYNVSDASNNQANTVSRTINVVDTTIPVITLIGNDSETIEVGSNYTDTGATATDNYDGDITNSIQVTGNVNTNIVGTYTLTYNVSDTSNNQANTVSRTINVIDTTIPVITLIGNDSETIEVGSNYTDAGATATDNYDGDITNSIQVTGNVNTNIVGTYTLTYNVSDTSNNEANTVSRTINVVSTLRVNDFYKQNVRIFPNPTTSNWTLESKTIIKSIQIINILGKVVKEIKPNSLFVKIDSDRLSKGIYIARINNVFSVKLIKSN
ncbi:immunoglobulin-like domain-containing protein [uncultured Polaribacter sp.]|uniref:immunoglobulin-like domain-containing protein n=1 Tax=uncultured Polaribacter sp. TaxID=174711 RepID=UPI00261D5514|nr:immunoglobulin-like domain-containing protein [uncultured Polaribacter sp.]